MVKTTKIQGGADYATVPGYPDYRVTPTGEVYSCLERGGKGRATDTWTKLKPYKEANGYCRVKFYNKDRLGVHQIVARAFIGSQERGIQVNHKDGNKSNNCVTNLEYATPLENTRHAVDNGLKVSRPQNQPEYSTAVIGIDKKTLSWVKFPSMSDAGRHGYAKGCIALVVAGKRKQHKGLEWVAV